MTSADEAAAAQQAEAQQQQQADGEQVRRRPHAPCTSPSSSLLRPALPCMFMNEAPAMLKLTAMPCPQPPAAAAAAAATAACRLPPRTSAPWCAPIATPIAAPQVVTPWDVAGGADGKIDYNKLVEQVAARAHALLCVPCRPSTGSCTCTADAASVTPLAAAAATPIAPRCSLAARR